MRNNSDETRPVWKGACSRIDSISILKKLKELNINCIKTVMGKYWQEFRDINAVVENVKASLDKLRKAQIKTILILPRLKALTAYGTNRQEYITHLLPTLIRGLKNHPAVLMYDMSNEPNLAVKDNLTFIRQVAKTIKNNDVNAKATIGGWRHDVDWHNPAHVALFIDSVDIICPHMYPPNGKGNGYLPKGHELQEIEESIFNVYTRLIATYKEHTEKPIFVSEFGIDYATLNANYGTMAEEAGAAFYKGALRAFSRTKPYGVIFFTGDPYAHEPQFSLLLPTLQWRMAANVVKNYYRKTPRPLLSKR